jgi:uridine kinase
LNEKIAHDEIGGFIQISEALHEKKIAEIADKISARADEVRFVLIAGPSSAGKTTLSKRLMVQLRVNGALPASVSVDDYFLDRKDTPRDEQGDLDFEHIEAIDLPFLNDHLQQLSLGREVEIPRFNFNTGTREFNGNMLQLQAGQILILEGIHCLNPRLAEALPQQCKYKVYISALGQLNLDRHNRISTTDSRLLRRMVRDHEFRGHSALRTLQMWTSVRRGEKEWIFPNQRHADIMFNSALEYEMAVLKPLAEPLLAEVKPDQPEYSNATRLLEFLGYFLAAPEDLVPASSILREYIGESSFEY